MATFSGKEYAEGRPSYSQQLYDFISSKTPSHHLAWDVGTGTGQAAASLANIYKHVIATDTSSALLEYAAPHPNITYKHTPSPTTLSMPDLEQLIGPRSSVDLVAVATALHWFDLPTFYKQVRWVLKKPNGVIAAWGYTLPEVSPAVDTVRQRVYNLAKEAGPEFEFAAKLVEQKYETIDFPFEPVDGLDHTGPIRFDMEKLMDLEAFLAFIRSWSSNKDCKEKGGELLTEDVIEDFKKAWGENGTLERVVIFPVYLRIGKVGQSC